VAPVVFRWASHRVVVRTGGLSWRRLDHPAAAYIVCLVHRAALAASAGRDAVRSDVRFPVQFPEPVHDFLSAMDELA